MDIEIISNHLPLTIYGIGAVAVNKDYTGTAFKASGRMWDIIKMNGIKNKGRNIWVYEEGDKVFAGVELEENTVPGNALLDKKELRLGKHAYYKHIGPYNRIKETGKAMTAQLIQQGFEVVLPSIEIYGHWTNDETKLETELLMCVK